MPDQDASPIYERLADEPSKWFARFLIYRNMGASRRSRLAAANEYLVLEHTRKTTTLQASNGVLKLYKVVPSAWWNASQRWNWKARAEAYDTMLQAKAEENYQKLKEFEAAEIARIMSTGYALKHERIQGLDKMARLVETSFRDEHGTMIFQWLTPDKIREYRGCLDDIAKELGDRVSRKELTGKEGGPIEIVTQWGGGAIAEADEEA